MENEIYNTLNTNLYKIEGLDDIFGSDVKEANDPFSALYSSSGEALIKQDGTSEFSDALIGGRKITIKPDGDIQAALDKLEIQGGGHLFLSAGTYTVESDLTVPSAVTISGENANTTVIDFNSTSSSFVIAGSDIYTTGTISSISAGGTQVNGSGTSWLANVTVNHQIFIENNWYKIAAVVSDTIIILAEPYKLAATFSGTYRAVILKLNTNFNNFTVMNSTDTAFKYTDVRWADIEDLFIISCNKGIEWTNFTFTLLVQVLVTNSTSNGIEISNGTFYNANNVACVANGGNGTVINNISSSAWIFSSNNGNSSDGFNCTDMTTCAMTWEANANGEQGVEFISGCNDNRITAGNFNGNTSDGIKVTATCDNNTFSNGVIRGNGGYGINIAASSCDNNVISGNHFGGNSSGAVNDSGTGTLIRGNIGVDDSVASNVSARNACTASDVLQESADTEETSPVGTTPALLKSIQVNAQGTIRIKVDIKKADAFGNAHAQIYKNGVAFGTDHSNTSETYATKTDSSLQCSSGDNFELYAWNTDGSGSCVVRNYRIYFDDDGLEETPLTDIINS